MYQKKKIPTAAIIIQLLVEYYLNLVAFTAQHCNGIK